MNVRIPGPQQVRGQISAPRSKAYTHRTLVSALLSHGESTIEKPLRSDDTNRTLWGIEAMGASVQLDKNGVRVSGASNPAKSVTLDCGESGATLRLLTAIAAARPTKTILTCPHNRPILPLVKALEMLGARAEVKQTGSGLLVSVQGPLTGGSARITGDVSSQFVSALLFAAPLAKSDVRVSVGGKMESRPYIDMTLAVLKMHGILATLEGDEFYVPAPQEYRPAFHRVPGDFSSAAFLLAAAGMAGDEVTISDVNGSVGAQPDSVILDILPEIGVPVKKEPSRIRAQKGRISGFEFDASDHPDLVPVLEVLACQAEGRSEIRGVRRLEYKESNRLRTVPEELRKMGAKVEIVEDRVIIEGGYQLLGTELRSHHDHRVAMACSVASLVAKGTTLIDDAGVVSKSYPGFFEDVAKLGVSLHVE